jgi:hypothetical protein
MGFIHLQIEWNGWLGGYRPQIPVLSALCPQLNLLNPPPNEIPGYATVIQRVVPNVSKDRNTFFRVKHSGKGHAQSNRTLMAVARTERNYTSFWPVDTFLAQWMYCWIVTQKPGFHLGNISSRLGSQPCWGRTKDIHVISGRKTIGLEGYVGFANPLFQIRYLFYK